MVQKNSQKPRPFKQANPSSSTAAQQKSSRSAASTTKVSNLSSAQAADSVKHQQRLLNIFSEAFSRALSSEQFPVLVQEIKQALFNREFASAFGREDYLEAYAARWSPTRALCYASVLSSLDEYLREVSFEQAPGQMDSLTDDVKGLEVQSKDEPSPSPDHEGTANGSSSSTSQINDPASLTKRRINMLSIGGCAAEHVAFASYLQETSSSGSLTLVDSGPWSHASSLIQTHLITPPSISKYASASIRASNVALLKPDQLNLNFSQQDVLNLEVGEIAKLAGTEPLLVSILFTLNELYTSAGIGKTTKFLGNLGQGLPGGSLLLILDSPGSYSEAPVGKEQKKYPMQWLLDHTLLKVDAGGVRWEKLESHESIWFRLPETLTYPMQLENMRYQMHLYRIDRNHD